MQIRRSLAIGGTCAVSLLSAATALASGTRVSVRVEGLNRTLMPAKTVTAPTRGSVTRGGAPAGQCKADSAAGALNVATRGKWTGSWSTQYKSLSVISILGEAHPFTSKDYWSIWVDGRYAPTGICGLKLHRGEQILFAALSDTSRAVPIVLSVPPHAVAGRPFGVAADYYTSSGARKPLDGVRLTGGVMTNAQGKATEVASRSGTLVLTASHPGYIRAEATIKVAP